MSRSGGGTYSLPSGNPVVSGTTIDATVHNNTMSDLAAEMTDSLSRSGKGAMTAPLELANGSAATPALSFDSDTDTGLYRVAANTLGVSVAGALALGVGADQIGIPNGAVGTPALTFNSDADTGLYRIGANNLGIAANGAKVVDVGTSGVAVTGQLSSTGSGAGNGVYGTGGATSGDGVKGVGGAPNGNGGVFDGTGTGAGIVVGTGYARFNGANPAAATAYSNTLTPKNIPKAMGLVNATGGTVTMTNGFNVSTTVSKTDSNLSLTITTSSAITDPCIIISPSLTGGSGMYLYNYQYISTTTFKVWGINSVQSGPANINFNTDTVQFSFVVFGTQ